VAEERANLVKALDDVMQLAGDIRMALNLRSTLEESGGVTDLAVFASGESITAKLSADDLAAIDARIAKFVDEFKAMVKKLKYEP